MAGKSLVVAASALLVFGCAKQEPRIGFIKVEKLDGRWMFISPDGRPFRSRGMDWANYDGFRDAKTGRSLYREANDAKYAGDKARWSADTAAQMSWKNNCFFLILAILACFPIAPALGKLLTRMGRGSRTVSKLNAILSVAIPPLLVFVSLLALVGNSYNPFLYFQF